MYPVDPVSELCVFSFIANNACGYSRFGGRAYDAQLHGSR